MLERALDLLIADRMKRRFGKTSASMTTAEFLAGACDDQAGADGRWCLDPDC